jgi:anti-anti-sigma factor
MSIIIEHTPDYHLVTLSGSFDLQFSQEFRKSMDHLLQVAKTDVVLDCQDMSFLDSSGVGAIVYLYKKLRAKDLSLRMRHMQRQPRELMGLLGIDKIIPMD